MIELRKADPGDVPQLSGLASAAYARYLPRLGRPPAR